MGIKHAKTSGKAAGSDPSQIGGPDWDADHVGSEDYSVLASNSSAVTDGSGGYDLPDLSIANVLAGTYLALVSFVGSNKTGEVRVTVTDGSGTVYWPKSASTKVTRHNGDNTIEFSDSGVIVVTSTSTVKVQGAASVAISNWTIYDRHLTLIKIA
jgi:hypothetical protein